MLFRFCFSAFFYSYDLFGRLKFLKLFMVPLAHCDDLCLLRCDIVWMITMEMNVTEMNPCAGTR